MTTRSGRRVPESIGGDARSGSTSRIPVLICVDVEPDARDLDRATTAPWRGFERLQERLAFWRPRLAARTGAPVAYSWFLRLDPQIADAYGAPTWPITRYAHLFVNLTAAGDELGLHTHALRWTGDRGWLTDDGDQGWVDHCLEVSFAAFREALGRDCRSFRFGDRWTSDATLRLIEQLGARYDLTLEPGRVRVPPHRRPIPATGTIPDLAAVPRVPYRPASADFRRPDPAGRRRLWMLPMSTSTIAWWLSPAAYLYRRMRRPTERPDFVSTLSLGLRPVVFRHVLDRCLRRGGPRPALTTVIRTDPAPVHVRWLDRNLTHLLGHPSVHRMVFATVEEAAAMLGCQAPATSPPPVDACRPAGESHGASKL